MKDGLIVGAAKQNKVNSTSKAGLAILSFRAQFVSLAYRLKGFWVILLQGNFLPKILSTQTMNTIFTLKKFQLSDANSRMNKPLFKTFLTIHISIIIHIAIRATLYKRGIKMNKINLNLMTFVQKSIFQDAQYRWCATMTCSSRETITYHKVLNILLCKNTKQAGSSIPFCTSLRNAEIYIK